MGLPEHTKNIVVTSTSGKRLRVINNAIVTPLGIGLSEGITVYATAGYVARVIGLTMRVNAPTSSLSGTHHFSTLYLMGTGVNIDKLACMANYNSNIVFDNSVFSGVTSATPALASDQMRMEMGLMFDDVVSFQMNYFNNTDVIQDQPRYYELLVLEEKVA